MADTPQPQPLTEADVAALKRERAAYQSRGLADRVAQVDEYLASRGYTETEPRERQPRERRAPGRQTAD